MATIDVLLLLLFAHALADYPLQGDFLARAKDHTQPLPTVPWWCAMAAHCAIHGGLVGIVTGYWWLGVAEFAAHWAIDWAKCDYAAQLRCESRGDDWHRHLFKRDQWMHIALKGVWLATWYAMGGVRP